MVQVVPCWRRLSRGCRALYKKTQKQRGELCQKRDKLSPKQPAMASALPKTGQTEPKAAWLQLCPPVQLPEPTSLGSREKPTKAAGCQCQSPAGARCSEHRVGTGATREPLECGGPGPAQGTARCAQELPEQKLDMGNGRQASVGFEYLQGLSCAQFRPVCSV